MGQLVRSAMRRGSMRRSSSGSSSGGTTPPAIATWDITLARYFFIDYDAGNDASLGYLDATPGTVFTAGAAAAVAVKTFTRLFQLIPLNGDNRTMVVLCKNRAGGAVYLDADGVTESVVRWAPYSGYRKVIRRGSSDLTNSVADRIQAGFITTIAGPGANGVWTVGSATTTVLTVASGTFTVDAAVGWRVRFLGNVTAALANVCINVQGNTATTVTMGLAQTISAAGDQFLIEGPGFTVGQWIANDNVADGQHAALNAPAAAVCTSAGIAVNSALANSAVFSGLEQAASGIETLSTTAADQLFCADLGALWASTGYVDEVGTLRTIGFSFRCQGGFQFQRINSMLLGAFAWLKTGASVSTRFTACNSTAAAARGIACIGSYFGSRITLNAMGGAPGVSAGRCIFGSGTAAGTIPTRSIGGWVLSGSNVAFAGVDTTAVAAGGAAFSTSSQRTLAGCAISWDNCTGTSGATTYGINMDGATGCTFTLGQITANTVTGALGDIRAQGIAAGVVFPHTTLTRTNVPDQQNNNWIGTAGRIVSEASLVTNSSGGALAIGDVVRGNGTSPQVTSAQADTLANSAVLGIMLTPAASGLDGYMAPPGAGTPSVTCTAAPTPGAIVYLSPTTARQGTTTEPVLTGTQQKVKLGRAVTVSGSNAQITFEPDLKPENTFEVQPIGVAVSNAAAAFSATQTWLIATGTYTADRAFTLEAISTLSLNARRIVSDFTTAGAFNILLTPNAADSIDGAPAGTALAIPAGSKATIEVRAMPSGGWKVM